jgi:N-methylhydantoinase B
MELFIESAGGGGWGEPVERDPEAVRRDVLDELVSREAARDVYHVVLSDDLALVDNDATSRARHKKRFKTTTLEEIARCDISRQEPLPTHGQRVSPPPSSPFKLH